MMRYYPVPGIVPPVPWKYQNFLPVSRFGEMSREKVSATLMGSLV